MRNWTVNELGRIESDIRLVSELVRADLELSPANPVSLLESAADCAWLKERIDIRERDGSRIMGRCDGCSTETHQPVIVCVDEMWDEMGAPTNLSYTYLCSYHLRNY